MSNKPQVNLSRNQDSAVIVRNRTNASAQLAGKINHKDALLKMEQMLRTDVEDLDLSNRVKNLLRQQRILQLGHLANQSKKDLLRIYNFGPKSIDEVQRVLKHYNLTFSAMLPIKWPKFAK